MSSYESVVNSFLENEGKINQDRRDERGDTKQITTKQKQKQINTMPCPIKRQYRFITTVILAIPIWLCCYIHQANCFSLQTSKNFVVRMDVEMPPAPFATAWKTKTFASGTTAFRPHFHPINGSGGSNRHKQQQQQRKSESSDPETTSTTNINIRRHKHGMPWKDSIDERKPSNCFFMPFFEWQLDHYESHLQNFTIDSDHFIQSESNNVRMVTMSCSSDEYRLIRMTYLDGGNQTQIFTSVAYPNGNLPILGCDFLSFQGGKRTLAIVDFQPIHGEEIGHDATYEHLLQPIRNKYESLQEPMSCRFFDPSQFFSNQTLMGKFGLEDKNKVWSDVFPAWQSYLQTHLGMTKHHSSRLSKTSSKINDVESYHAAYDTYCLERDPAHPMFNSLFGPDFADDFLYNTMFPLAKRPEEKVEEGN